MKPATQERLSPFDCMYDARFESMRDYPRKKQLFRNHVDMERQCEKTKRHLKSYQRVVMNDCNRKIQKMEERFSKLICQTFQMNTKKTSGLLYSYNKWARGNNSRVDTSFDKAFDGNIRAMMVSNEIDRADCETPIVTCDVVRDQKRLPSHRSLSVDNLPTEIQQRRQRGTGHVTVFGIGATCHGDTPDVLFGLDREITSSSLCDLRTSNGKQGLGDIKIAKTFTTT